MMLVLMVTLVLTLVLIYCYKVIYRPTKVTSVSFRNIGNLEYTLSWDGRTKVYITFNGKSYDVSLERFLDIVEVVNKDTDDRAYVTLPTSHPSFLMGVVLSKDKIDGVTLDIEVFIKAIKEETK